MSPGPLYVLCGEVSVQLLRPLLNQVVHGSAIKLYEVLTHFDINPVPDSSSASIFSHSVGGLFVLSMVSL